METLNNILGQSFGSITSIILIGVVAFLVFIITDKKASSNNKKQSKDCLMEYEPQTEVELWNTIELISDAQDLRYKDKLYKSLDKLETINPQKANYWRGCINNLGFYEPYNQKTVQDYFRESDAFDLLYDAGMHSFYSNIPEERQKGIGILEQLKDKVGGASFRLAMEVYNNEPQKQYEYLRKSYNLGDPRAAWCLGAYYEDHDDNEKALTYYEYAFKRGVNEAYEYYVDLQKRYKKQHKHQQLLDDLETNRALRSGDNPALPPFDNDTTYTTPTPNYDYSSYENNNYSDSYSSGMNDALNGQAYDGYSEAYQRGYEENLSYDQWEKYHNGEDPFS